MGIRELIDNILGRGSKQEESRDLAEQAEQMQPDEDVAEPAAEPDVDAEPDASEDAAEEDASESEREEQEE